MKSLLFTLGALIAFCGVALANQPEKESCVGSPNSVEMEACQWTKDVEYVVESVYDEDREETVYSFLVKNHRPYYVTLYVTVVQLQKEWIIVITDVEHTDEFKNLTHKLAVRDNIPFEVPRVEFERSM